MIHGYTGTIELVEALGDKIPERLRALASVQRQNVLDAKLCYNHLDKALDAEGREILRDLVALCFELCELDAFILSKL